MSIKYRYYIVATGDKLLWREIELLIYVYRAGILRSVNMPRKRSNLFVLDTLDTAVTVTLRRTIWS